METSAGIKKLILVKCKRDRDNCPVEDLSNRAGDKWFLLTVIVWYDLAVAGMPSIQASREHFEEASAL